MIVCGSCYNENAVGSEWHPTEQDTIIWLCRACMKAFCKKYPARAARKRDPALSFNLREFDRQSHNAICADPECFAPEAHRMY